MTMTTDRETTLPDAKARKLAYIRGLEANEIAALPRDAINSVDDLSTLCVLVDEDGEQLAIIEGRDAAVLAAKANNYRPLSVH